MLITKQFVEAYAKARKTLEFLGRRQRAYQLCFGSPAGKAVLKDLAYYCRADRSAFHVNERAHAAIEGRREVWLRIAHHLKQLYELYGGPVIQEPTE